MNKFVAIPFILSVLAAPALCFAQSQSQSTAGLTRAQVVADLVRLEKAGYNPSAGEDSRYPVDIQAAEARVAAEDAASTTADAGSSNSNSK